MRATRPLAGDPKLRTALVGILLFATGFATFKAIAHRHFYGKVSLLFLTLAVGAWFFSLPKIQAKLRNASLPKARFMEKVGTYFTPHLFFTVWFLFLVVTFLWVPPLFAPYGVAFGLSLFFTRFRLSSKSRAFVLGVFAIVAAALAAYFVFGVYHYSVNLPFADDYTSFVSSLHLLKQGEYRELMELLFIRHFMEHIPGGGYLLILTASVLAGGFSAPVFATLGLVLFALFLWQWVRFGLANSANKKVLALPALFLLLQFQYYQSVIWPTNIASVFLFHLMVLLTFMKLEKGDLASSIQASLAAFVATFTFGSGFLLFAFGLLYLAFQRRYRAMLYWLIPMALALALYFWDFTDPVRPSIQLEKMGGFVLRFLGLVFTLGGKSQDMLVEWPQGAVVAGAFGLIGLVVLYLMLSRGLISRRPALSAYLLYLLVNALLAARQRALVGSTQVFQSRYHLYSALFVSGLYFAINALYPDWVRRHLVSLCTLAASIAIASNIYVRPGLERHGNNLAVGYYLSVVRTPQKLNIADAYGHQIYLAGFFPYQQALEDRVYEPPLKEISKRIASSEVASDPSRARVPPQKAVRELNTHSDEMFFEVSFESDLQWIGPLYVQIEGTGSLFEATRLEQRNMSPSLFRRYYPSPKTWVAWIPKEKIQMPSPKIAVLQ